MKIRIFLSFLLLTTSLIAQDLLTHKMAVFVIVARDSSLSEEKDLDNVEALVKERIGNMSGYTAINFLKNESAYRKNFTELVKKGRYDDLPLLVQQANPETPLTGIFYVSLVKDPQYEGQGYISYFYYDIVKKKRDFRFIEKPVSMREMTVMDRLLEILEQPLGSSETVVDVYKPVSICFLIDNSGSMLENDNDYNPKDLLFNPIQTARANAIRLVLNKLVINDEFAFVFFSGKTSTFNRKFQRIKDRKQVQSLSSRIISRIGMEPGTDISEAFRKAREIIPLSQLSNVYIIMLSDGNPTDGITDLAQLRKYAKESFKSIPMFVIGLEGDQTKKGYKLEKTFLRNLAYDSGGTFNIIKIKNTAQNRYSETAMAVDSIFNIIRKEQTILNDEKPISRQVLENKLVYSWEFNINSDASEFTILIDPFEANYIIEILDPKGNVLPPANIELIRLARSASCKVSFPNCKGQWKLNVKIPQ